MKIEQGELDEIIANHGRWLQGEGGKRAGLSGANLIRADLCGTNLREANLNRADLYRADLRGADLYEADLYEANLCEADLCGANLYEADLRGADLCGTNLRGANLHRADLEGANLPIGVYQIVGAGRCNRCTTYDSINDRIICGCWDDGAGNHLDSFARRIEEIYGTKGETPNSKYYAEYMSAINFFRAMKELK